MERYRCCYMLHVVHVAYHGTVRIFWPRTNKYAIMNTILEQFQTQSLHHQHYSLSSLLFSVNGSCALKHSTYLPCQTWQEVQYRQSFNTLMKEYEPGIMSIPKNWYEAQVVVQLFHWSEDIMIAYLISSFLSRSWSCLRKIPYNIL